MFATNMSIFQLDGVYPGISFDQDRDKEYANFSST